MPLKIQNAELMELMKNFYILTGIKIVLIDENHNGIMTYPEENTPFCTFMRQNVEFKHQCDISDKISFETCKRTRKLTMYECHAGLIEAVAPIMEKDAVIGYIMFGQIVDKKRKKDFLKAIPELCAKYGCTEDISQKTEKIRYKTDKQLVAAANILEACTSYILSKDLVKPSRIQLFNNIDNYITEHIDEEISVETLQRKFNISRTRLYVAMKPYTNGGIALYIRKKRLAAARELIENTEMPISEISSRTGFSDYNYFLRIFKKYYGISPKKMRRM